MGNMDRREFLKTAAVGGGAFGWAPNGAAHAAKQKTDPVALVPLGKEIKACRISCGTGMAGHMRQTNQTRLGKEKFEALLNYAYDRGVRHYDLADLYGTHEYVGRALKGKPREEIQLVTKIWTREGGIPEKERPSATIVVERFLKELQTDYLDLVQLHCMEAANWNEIERPQMDALEELKHRGLVRAHGCSVHSLDAMKTAAKEPWVDVLHARVNPFGHRTDAPMEEVIPVLRELKAAGKGIIGMKLIGEGSFDEEKRKESLKFAMDLGVVDCMTVGFEAPEQVDDFIARVRGELVARA